MQHVKKLKKALPSSKERAELASELVPSKQHQSSTAQNVVATRPHVTEHAAYFELAPGIRLPWSEMSYTKGCHAPSPNLRSVDGYMMTWLAPLYQRYYEDLSITQACETRRNANL